MNARPQLPSSGHDIATLLRGQGWKEQGRQPEIPFQPEGTKPTTEVSVKMSYSALQCETFRE